MADQENFEKKSALARHHHEAAMQHAEAAHHHRQAAFHLSTGEGLRAKQHGIAAVEHGSQAQASESQSGKSVDDYDLDVNFETVDPSVVQPHITSISLCTPGCAKTGSGESFCCAGHTDICTH